MEGYKEAIEALKCYIEYLEDIKFKLEAKQFYIRYLQEKEEEEEIMHY